MDSSRNTKSLKIKRLQSVQNRNNHFKKLDANNINNSLIIQKRHQAEKDSQKNNLKIKVKTKNKNILKTDSARENKFNNTAQNLKKKNELNNTINESSLMEQNKNKKLAQKNEINEEEKVNIDKKNKKKKNQK